MEDESSIQKWTKWGEKNSELITDFKEFTSNLSSYYKDDMVLVRLI